MNVPLPSRADFAAIAGWVRPGTRILDLGCGDGTLLNYLVAHRKASGYGVEINPGDVLTCIQRGINVIQGDIERGLSDFTDGSFDYVILSQTLQAVKNSEYVVKEMLRVGRQGIVTFPNFGYWYNRLQVMFGRMPVSHNLPYNWYDTPNIHLCTIADFEKFCANHNVRILERIVIRNGGTVSLLPNLFGSLAVYRFERG